MKNIHFIQKLLLLLVILLPHDLSSQVLPLKPPMASSTVSDGNYIWQRLSVVSGSEISKLLQQQFEQNKKSAIINGFRIQLYFGSGAKARAQAEKVKNEFASAYPESRIYLIFKSPDFIVRTGDYRTKSEALKVLRSLPFNFSNGFIVSDEIAFPELFPVASSDTIQPHINPDLK